MKEIGGYFELEVNPVESFKPHEGAICLNSGRSSLRYIIRASKIKKIHAPYYTCWCVFDTLKEENVEVEFYNIDKNFMPVCEFDENDFVLYTNYFGICTKQAKTLSEKYKNLILDNAQAFFAPLELGFASFNSVRKFFGVPDGSYLKCKGVLDLPFEKDISYKRALYMLKRHDLGANAAYQDFQLSEATFELNKKIKLMSNLTSHLLSGINFENARKQRLSNFQIYHNALKGTNELQFELDFLDVPMVYPYLIEKEGLRQKLIENKIYVAKYWTPLDDYMYESKFEKYLLPLPLDQRYGKKDIEEVLCRLN